MLHPVPRRIAQDNPRHDLRPDDDEDITRQHRLLYDPDAVPPPPFEQQLHPIRHGLCQLPVLRCLTPTDIWHLARMLPSRHIPQHIERSTNSLPIGHLTTLKDLPHKDCIILPPPRDPRTVARIRLSLLHRHPTGAELRVKLGALYLVPKPYHHPLRRFVDKAHVPYLHRLLGVIGLADAQLVDPDGPLAVCTAESPQRRVQAGGHTEGAAVELYRGCDFGGSPCIT